MVREALKKNPCLSVCAFGGNSLKEAGAKLLFDMTPFSVVGLVEVLKNYSFFKNLLGAIAAWIEKYSPSAVCFIDYPGFNLRLASELKRRGISAKGGGSVRTLFYISPQIWAWKASRRFKMAETLDSLAVIFPFETECYSDTGLETVFVGHPFLEDGYKSPVFFDPKGDILLLPGSRGAAVSRIFPAMLSALELLPGERAVAVYPTDDIRFRLASELERRPELVQRVRLCGNSHIPIGAKAVMMSSGTMSLSCSLEGIPGAIVYRANPITYAVGRALVRVKFLSIANILLKKPAWREFIQFSASPKKLAAYMRKCLGVEAEKEFASYARALKELLRAPSNMSAADWLVKNIKP